MDDTRDIDDIRADIERTRARLRDTSEALGHKADLPARTMSLVGDAAELAGEWLRGRVPPPRPRSASNGAADADADGPGIARKAGDAIASVASAATSTAKSGASKAADVVAGAASGAADHAPTADDARAHPMLVGALALAAGVAAGLAIPPTRAEERAAESLADGVR